MIGGGGGGAGVRGSKAADYPFAFAKNSYMLQKRCRRTASVFVRMPGSLGHSN